MFPGSLAAQVERVVERGYGSTVSSNKNPLALAGVDNSSSEETFLLTGKFFCHKFLLWWFDTDFHFSWTLTPIRPFMHWSLTEYRNGKDKNINFRHLFSSVQLYATCLTAVVVIEYNSMFLLPNVLCGFNGLKRYMLLFFLCLIPVLADLLWDRIMYV